MRTNLMRSQRKGQSTVEWALLLSVLVVAVVAASYAYVPAVSKAMKDAGAAMATLYTSGDVAGP